MGKKEVLGVIWKKYRKERSDNFKTRNTAEHVEERMIDIDEIQNALLIFNELLEKDIVIINQMVYNINEWR